MGQADSIVAATAATQCRIKYRDGEGRYCTVHHLAPEDNEAAFCVAGRLWTVDALTIAGPMIQQKLREQISGDLQFTSDSLRGNASAQSYKEARVEFNKVADIYQDVANLVRDGAPGGVPWEAN